MNSRSIRTFFYPLVKESIYKSYFFFILSNFFFSSSFCLLLNSTFFFGFRFIPPIIKQHIWKTEWSLWYRSYHHPIKGFYCSLLCLSIISSISSSIHSSQTAFSILIEYPLPIFVFITWYSFTNSYTFVLHLGHWTVII